MLTVCIRVGPHPIAHRGQLEQSGIEIAAVLASGQGEGCGASIGQSIAVLAGISALKRWAEDPTAGADELQLVGARRQVGEGVKPSVRCGLGRKFLT